MKELYEQEDENIGLILVNGDEAVYYSCSLTNQKKIDSITGNLPNGHRKGGQSAPRFQRLYDQALKAYNKRIVEKALFHFCKNGNPTIETLVLSGNGVRIVLLKELFQEVESRFRIQTFSYCTLEEVVENVNFTTEIEHKELEELLRTKPDLLVFGSEIEEFYNNVKNVYVFESSNDKKEITFRNRESIDWLKQFGGRVGVLYYPIPK